jgi:hypothetical protein
MIRESIGASGQQHQETVGPHPGVEDYPTFSQAFRRRLSKVPESHIKSTKLLLVAGTFLREATARSCCGKSGPFFGDSRRFTLPLLCEGQKPVGML